MILRRERQVHKNTCSLIDDLLVLDVDRGDRVPEHLAVVAPLPRKLHDELELGGFLYIERKTKQNVKRNY